MGDKAVRTTYRNRGGRLAGLLALALLATAGAGTAVAATLVQSPFLSSYDGWTDTYDYGVVPEGLNYPAWGVLLEKGALMENSNGWEKRGGYSSTLGGRENDGQYKPYMMVNSATTGSTYTLTGTLENWDNDGLGLIFGYQDNNNYFRLGLRREDTGGYGFNQGLAVSKVVGGVITPFVAGPVTSFVGPPNGVPFNLKVKVNGGEFEVYASRPDGREPSTPQISGFDSDLATLGAGKYGMMSWGSRVNGGYTWGSLMHSMTVDNGSNGSIDRDHDFSTASPVAWRKLTMTNAANAKEATLAEQGNFALDFRDGTIQDDTNGYVSATATKSHIDFLGPAIVVDESGAAAMENIEMKVRITCDDNEGPGLLVRVQNDNTFYRINFTNEATGTGSWRPYQGMSIQKCVDAGPGVAPTWTDLFHETTPQYLYTYRTTGVEPVPFDVKVKVINNTADTAATIFVEVIHDPEGFMPTTYTYTPVTDSSSPLLTGTVGLTNWGAGVIDPAMYGTGVMFSGYGGDVNMPLVIDAVAEGEASAAVPEPGAVVLLAGALAALAVLGRSRRRGMIAPLVAALCLAASLTGAAGAATLIGSPFLAGYDGWTDMNPSPPWLGVAGSTPLWGVLVNNDALCDMSDGAAGNGGSYDGGSAGDGRYKPWIMVNSNYATPSKYTLTGTLASSDDDGLGLVFGYQDNDNYLRVGMRTQGTGSYGFAQGISFDKVVGGVITQVAIPDAMAFGFLTNNTPFDLKVEVDGTVCTVYGPAVVTGAPTVYFSGSIPELATLGHQYGFMNWRSRYVGDAAVQAVKRCFGAQFHSLTVDNNSDGSIDRNHTFGAASPLPWRELFMRNSAGNPLSLEYDKGNFRIELANRGIVDDTNPSEDATATAPHVDFIGSAIAVDSPAALAMENYEMRVRMECGDNEGPGLLVRVQDDNTFYRINFTAEAMGTGDIRPPQGMSIQKCDGRGGGNPVWTELFRETSNPFIYTNVLETGETFPFDVKVTVTNNAGDTATTIRVDVIDDPEVSATPYTWTVTDNTNPILTGTVGLTNWGAGNIDFGQTIGVRWSGYGGDVNAPLVVEATVVIPEIPGDADSDGDVDADDAGDMAAAWGTLSGATWAMGDFNKDGKVNAMDASILAANWGYVWPGGEGSAAVPEPGLLVLLFGAVAAVAAARRR